MKSVLKFIVGIYTVAAWVYGPKVARFIYGGRAYAMRTLRQVRADTRRYMSPQLIMPSLRLAKDPAQFIVERLQHHLTYHLLNGYAVDIETPVITDNGIIIVEYHLHLNGQLVSDKLAYINTSGYGHWPSLMERQQVAA